MIHQLIFAAPKPGMSDEDFQDYWVNTHAVQFASKIPQITKYMVDTTLPYEGQDTPFRGVAEIYLNNDEDELASLQTPEFIEGARKDEPNWAAFWLTVALDADDYEIVTGPPLTPDPTWVKLIVLGKRTEGLPLEEFRAQSLGEQAALMSKVPGLRRYQQCMTRDVMYAVGEAPLDVAYQLWFDDLEALAAAQATPEFQAAEEHLGTITEGKYVHPLLVQEHWVIGPEPR